MIDSQLDATRLVGYLSSHIQRTLMEKLLIIILRKEATSVLADFHAGPWLSWSNWNLEMLVLGREKNWRTLGARRQPTTNSRSNPGPTLARGEHSHHCAIPPPHQISVFRCSLDHTLQSSIMEPRSRSSLALFTKLTLDQGIRLILWRRCPNFFR